MHSILIEWVFHTSKFGPRLYMYKDIEDIILIAIIVDDTAFASNNTRLLRALQQKLQAGSYVSLFGKMRSLIG